MARRADVPCAGDCGRLLWAGTGSLPPGEAMCRDCRRIRQHACAWCGNPCPVADGPYCSPVCGKAGYHAKRATTPEHQRLRRLANNQRRRARIAAADTDATADAIRFLFECASLCPLCGVRMLDGGRMWSSKSLDHIIPLGVGGPHVLRNLRVICRWCNERRPKDGSDVTDLDLLVKAVAVMIGTA